MMKNKIKTRALDKILNWGSLESLDEKAAAERFRGISLSQATDLFTLFPVSVAEDLSYLCTQPLDFYLPCVLDALHRPQFGEFEFSYLPLVVKGLISRVQGRSLPSDFTLEQIKLQMIYLFGMNWVKITWDLE